MGTWQNLAIAKAVIHRPRVRCIPPQLFGSFLDLMGGKLKNLS